mmetsp:Transcript_8444/g.12678  ORF Transcript_8444/g.12678 Transcript_8444/m.12678 type:complete len:116 (+) Transcript_8444:233-580(+)
MFYSRWNKLNPNQKRLWKVGGYVLGFGTIIKFGYFYISRVMIIDSLEARDKSARKYLKESKDFARFASEDRRRRTPELTPDQREQLQNYLLLIAQKPENKDVYPHEMRDMMNKKK